ncbi:hypothetical protein [Actinocrispum sp. NPDC049592]|uniref:hypothetical protein n=1 Tax=Actinocrispum sp. NPDC049592 TaxID=3154835 RepID=UPI003416AA34
MSQHSFTLAADPLLAAGHIPPGMTQYGEPLTAATLVRDFHGPQPTITVLCGSTRFVDTFNEWRKRLTYAGHIVLSIEIVTTQAADEDPQNVDPQRKVRLDELHLRKIDLADRVMVLNVGGYIGESTRNEIAYARAHGKPIEFLEQ